MDLSTAARASSSSSAQSPPPTTTRHWPPYAQERTVTASRRSRHAPALKYAHNNNLPPVGVQASRNGRTGVFHALARPHGVRVEAEHWSRGACDCGRACEIGAEQLRSRRPIASAGSDRRVAVWDLTKNAFVSYSKDRTARIGQRNAVSLSDTLIVSRSGDRSVQLWDATMGMLRTFENHHSQGIASIEFMAPYVASGSSDNHLHHFDIMSVQ